MLYVTCEKCDMWEALQDDQSRFQASAFYFEFNALNDPVFTCVDCKKTAKFEYEDDKEDKEDE
jgi:RNase P subunit RPR2